ncbi:P-loop containing nucleoside triphosphate hydrolase protein, partial [Mycena olivaceomarginata]
MPRRPTSTGIHLDHLISHLTPTVNLLNELNDLFSSPFIQPIVNTLMTLTDVAKNVKRNKSECARLLENVHQVLYAIINLHIKSETTGLLPPSMMDHIGTFMETLHKIYRFIEAQQEGNKIKQLFRINETNTLLKACHAGLDQAFDVFRIVTGTTVFNGLSEMNKATTTMHEQLLKLIPSSNTSTISDGSSVHAYLSTAELRNLSSNSFSLLPARPKIFHGRESELNSIIKILNRYPAARIAILGAGGMGKTSLARAVIHHPEISTKFGDRFFVSADSATSAVDLAALIGLHVGMNPGKDLTKAIVQYFAQKISGLLILDNLETVWEPIQSRAGVEEFLSLLTEVDHLALVITMRGAERPAKVHWSHPFLLPLQPLSDEAAHQTFIDITDDSHTSEDINQLLRLTDNMPLAVNLIAHLADYEGSYNVLTRWEAEKTTLLSIGYDKRSNLDASITVSLSSPRVTPGSKELLSLLSVLPDGLSDLELLQSDLPIPNILGCKSTLLATSLAYQDEKKRLRSLVPIREHVYQFLPPSQGLIQTLCKHFYAILKLYRKYKGEQLRPMVDRVTLNLGNLHDILKRGLNPSDPHLTDTIYSVLSLNIFYRATGRGSVRLMDSIHTIFPQSPDHRLEIAFFIEVLHSYRYYPTLLPENLIAQAISHFEHIKDPILECESPQHHADHSFVLRDRY